MSKVLQVVHGYLVVRYKRELNTPTSEAGVGRGRHVGIVYFWMIESEL